MLEKIWKMCGSIRVTYYLLMLVSFNLAIASFFVRFYPEMFRPLNNVLLQDWLRLYGRNNLDKMWWLWTLFAFLVALGINTGVCTLDRVRNLLAKRNALERKIFILKITPSFIHICFLIMLSGHLISMISGFNKRIPVIPGYEMAAPVQVQIVNEQCVYYESPALMKGQLDQCSVSFRVYADGNGVVKQISFLNPLTYQGYSFHLGRDKKAKDDGLQIIIRRDPGLKYILSGFTLLVLLMLWYFPTLQKKSKGG